MKATALIRRVLALIFLPPLLAGCARPPAAPPSAPATGTGFPLVLTDAQGVEVTVPARPERIVSASPAVTEILFALGAGDRVVAVTDRSNYPPEATERPKVGGFFTPSVEKVLGARPDLVIGQRGNPPDFVETLRRSGVPVFTVDPQTLDQILSTIRKVAQLIGDEAAGESLVGDMQRRLAAIAARTAVIPEDERPTAFLVLQVSPPWTAGSGTFQDDAIRAAGGRNIAAAVEGFRAFSTESLVAGNPDFLLLSTMDGDPDRMKRDVLADPVLSRLSAVRSNHLVILEADPLMRAGPRIVDAIEEMARAFYPQQSPRGR